MANWHHIGKNRSMRSSLERPFQYGHISHMKVVSISELKNSLSAHLDLARVGEIVVVTDRGSPVVTLQRIAPGSLPDGAVDLVADGIVAPRRECLSVDAFFDLPAARCAEGFSSAIVEERQDDR